MRQTATAEARRDRGRRQPKKKKKKDEGTSIRDGLSHKSESLQQPTDRGHKEADGRGEGAVTAAGNKAT